MEDLDRNATSLTWVRLHIGMQLVVIHTLVLYFQIFIPINSIKIPLTDLRNQQLTHNLPH